MPEKPKPPGMFDKLKDSFGFGNRWEKEYEYVMSLSDEEVKKEADIERKKAGVLPDVPAVATTEPVTELSPFGMPTTSSEAPHTVAATRASGTRLETITNPPPTSEATSEPSTEETQRVVVPFPQPTPVPQAETTASVETHAVSAKEIFKTKVTYDISTPSEQVSGQLEGRDTGSIDSAIENAELLVVGDAHGSALKILETVILSGMAEMPKESAIKFKRTYNEILRFTYDPDPTHRTEVYPFRSVEDKESFTKLQDVLLECLDSLTWTGDDRSLTLIGDIVSDRGLSDIVTMKLLSKLRESGTVTTLAGNHDIDFLMRRAMAMHQYSGIDHMALDAQRISQLRAEATYTDSHRALIRDFFEHLTLFSYRPESGTFFSHANFRKELLAPLIARLQFLEPITKASMPSFVSRANEWCQSVFQSILENTAVTKEDLQLISKLVWDRKEYTVVSDIPFAGVVNAFVHGHDTPFSNLYSDQATGGTKAICLDDSYRKREQADDTSTMRLYIEPSEQVAQGQAA